MKPEPRRLAGQLGRSARGVAWHGPSVAETLHDVTAGMAARRVADGVHTIWELVLHIEAWQRYALEVLQGGSSESLTGDDDWPPVDEGSRDWESDKARFLETNAALVEAVREFPEEQLDEVVPGREFHYYFLLHGVVQHNLYHAGQIAVLKRLL